MLYPLEDTIAAIASPTGGAARGIVRLSGPDVCGCLVEMFAAETKRDLRTVDTNAVLPGSIRIATATSPLPCDLYFWPTSKSYTGQPAAEIHTLGSTPLLEAVLDALRDAGARLAQPGEFTLRAFLAGRLDLTQAEAVLGVIDATEAKQLDVALAQLAGGLAKPLDTLRDILIDLLAHLEAGFDFADEDLDFISPQELIRQLTTAAESVDRLIRKMQSRTDRVASTRVVLVGWPNTGKSSLFNALAEQQGALVSKHAGTTRDYLTAELDLDGVRCLLVDTAGIDPDDSSDALHNAAQDASSRQHRQADLRAICLDSNRPLNDWERSRLAADDAHLVVLTKVDTGRSSEQPEPAIATSSVTGQGIDVLRQAIRAAILTTQTSDTDVVAGTAVRCRQSLLAASESLERACRVARSGHGEELVAAELRTALDEIGLVVGAVYTDDILDRIFSRFCVGK